MDDLPFELLSQIYTHIDTAKSVSRLSRTCRTLYNFTEKEGWKIFLKTRFPSLTKPTQPNDYLEACHGLTTLSRNWDRKAFVARYIKPLGSITNLRTWERIPAWDPPRGQTMLYQPCIDSYEVWTGGDWRSRYQVLAWSAGTELIVRIKNTGAKAAEKWHATSRNDHHLLFDQFMHWSEWYTYKPPHSLEGRDDITSLNLVKPNQKESGATLGESIIYGTADGNLSQLNIDLDNRTTSTRSYKTHGGIICTALSRSESSLLAVSQARHKLVLYPASLDQTTERINPLSECDIVPEEVRNYCRIQCTAFVAEDQLAVGVGPWDKPLHIYKVSPSGLTKDPIRTYPSMTLERESVYSVAPLPPTALGGSSSDQVFLSGDYGGMIHLHDLRSRSPFEACWWDSANNSAIYALQTQGRERIIAGAARHTSLMVYDLRVTGGRKYRNVEVHTRSATPNVPKTHNSTNEKASQYQAFYNWNVFLSPRNTNSFRQWGQGHSLRHNVDSPVYSLSLPSPSSPTLFAGVEGEIVQLDFTNVNDAYPDPMYEGSIQRTRNGEIDVARTWDPCGDVMNLGMYDKTEETAFGMHLYVQAGVARYEGEVLGLDNRWRTPNGQDLRERRGRRRRY